MWREVGFGIILFLARLLSMPDEPIEAARIDGAGWWQRLRFVILPELRGTIEFYVVVAAITMLAWVFATSTRSPSGGPGTSSTVLELYIYNQGLRNSLPGMASAVAVILFIATLVFVVAAGHPALARQSRGRARVSAAAIPARAAPALARRAAAAAPARARPIVALYPVFFMITTAFKSQGQYLDNPYALPWPLSLGNFGDAVRGGAFLTWFKNSVILTLGGVIISTAAAGLAAFAIARMRFRGRDVLLCSAPRSWSCRRS